jgi:hypothetical protein
MINKENRSGNIKEVIIAVMVTIAAFGLVRTLMNLLNRRDEVSTSHAVDQDSANLLTQGRQARLNQGYYSFYDSRYIQTQGMFDEDIKRVQWATSQRTHEDIAFFEETDLNIVPVFHKIVPDVPVWRLYLISHNPFILTWIWLMKLYHNRARPYQVADINTLESTSGHTPSYPSGHAVQAYALAKHLKRLRPDKAQELDAMADKVAYTRQLGGYHFPTDTEYSRHLIESNWFV